MANFKYGWASRDVSTDKPVMITGQAHVRLNEGIMDPVTTTALVMEDGNDCVIFISLDHVGIRCGLVDEVRAKTKALRPEIPVEKITMNVTHAHTGASFYPNSFCLKASDLPEDQAPVGDIEIADGDEYRAWLSDTMAEMVAEAWDNRSEGGIAYGYGYAIVSHSRRTCYFDDTSLRNKSDVTNTYGGAINGHAVMYGNTNDDQFDGYEAGADPFINLMYTFDKDGKLTGAIINVPCPSQCSEHEWHLSASFWNEVRVMLRKKYGDIFVLPQCAAAGDLAPRILHYKAAQARRFALKYGITKDEHELAARMDIAERICSAFDEVLSWAKNDIKTNPSIEHKVSTVQLERSRVSEEEYAFCVEGLKAARAQQFVTTDDPKADLITNTKIVSNRKRFLRVMARHDAQDANPNLPMELHVLRVGDVAFATNRFELYMDFQHRMQARSPFAQTFIIQLSGQPGQAGGSYLATERGRANRGYSAINFSCEVSPKGGQQLVEETVKELKELYENM